MNPRVLVVDDESGIAENLQAFLEDEGMGAESVGSAEEAVQRVRLGGAFDVCIMDMRLPGMDGNAGIRVLHELCPGLRFIIHTGSAGYVLPEELRAMGIDESRLFHKPLADMTPIADIVRKLTDG